MKVPSSATGITSVEMIVALSGVSLVANNTNTTVSKSTTAVLLDSGSTLSYLPEDVSSALYDALGVKFNEQTDEPLCDCALANSTSTIEFIFSGQVISVPISEMVLEGDGSGTKSLNCIFGIVAQPPQTGPGTSYTLGDTFIRSAYVVYDLANNQISLAQTDFGATGSNVMEIGTGKNSVPSASGIANPATATVTGTAVIGGVTGTSTATGTSTGTSSATPSSEAGAIAQAHLGVWAGVAAAGLVLAL